ncbi:MAG: phosphocholine cytidylyltransferase family protein [Treponema sp.]|nr:phosphocholine cytidylyltransferase family protein [Treponema sp.]MEE3435026.1 phosphocholine cytidylyltransferase family protein [Treponema sp.]
MQALILAAGTGSRLKQYTQKVPKCMVPVNGVPMIERAIDSLVEAGIKKLYIGLGYKADVLKKFIADTFGAERLNGMEIDFVENPVYDKTNNIYSLWLAREIFAQDDTALLESDLVFKKDLIKNLVQAKEKNLAVVSRYEDWMDGTCATLDTHKNILDFIPKSAQKPADAANYYKTVNIYKFSRDFTQSYYLPFLQTFMDVFGKNNYYETCLKFLAQTDPTLLKAYPIPGDVWYEIDNPDDLREAEKRF